jgi:hypothetical protein
MYETRFQPSTTCRTVNIFYCACFLFAYSLSVYLIINYLQHYTLGPTQPPIQWIPGALSPGVKRQGHEADHSPPASAEVENGGAITPHPHMSSWHSA